MLQCMRYMGVLYFETERNSTMGKNLKGKECGKGICQRKDGLYYARFVTRGGKRAVSYTHLDVYKRQSTR